MKPPPLLAHLLAVLIVLHVGVITFQAIPLPRKTFTEEAVETNGVRKTWEAWGGIAAQLGLTSSPEAFADRMLVLNNQITTSRQRALAPFRIYFHNAGTAQSWRMFSTVRTRAARLELYVQYGEEWEAIFLDHGEPQWRARLLNQERVRTVRATYSKRFSNFKKDYRRFSAWLAARAAEDFPEATQFRSQYRKVIIQRPAAIREAGGLKTGEVFWIETHRLEPLR